MSLRIVPAAAISAVLFTTSAEAVSVTNRDDSDHKVTVMEGSTKQDHVIKAGGNLDGICLRGCLLRLGDNTDDPFELEGPEVTWIEGGELFEEQLNGAPASPDGSAVQP